ncbi:MAG: DUF2202 domain-containing protein [Geobacteraceae bacterium]|nr:DUF2202 domain-containing protein [Geobacteraceae bacterium]
MKTTLYICMACITGLTALSTIFTDLTGSTAWAARNVTSTVTTALSGDEAEMLTFMREEEKLARDVYIALYQKWGVVTFSNISKSEQTHMDTLKKKLDKYLLPDPAQPVLGVFTNSDLQAKYDQLIATGSQSLIDGLSVGATIEEIDMIDIQHAIDVTTHLDMITSYQNLLEGSKNHLRAYVKALAAHGVTYSPQLISLELYNAIIGL